MTSKEEADGYKTRLKTFIESAKFPILREDHQNELWLLTVQVGPFKTVISYDPDVPFAIVSIRIGDANDSSHLKTLNKLIQDPKERTKFMFNMHPILNSTVTSYTIDMRDDTFYGFVVYKSLFMCDDRFSIRDIDSVFNAVLAIAHAGSIYVAYKNGEIAPMQTNHNASPFDRMYG